MTEYAVMAETRAGNIHTLRRGFPTRDAAEDHPVKLASWKRVWVEPVKRQAKHITTPPTLPWVMEWNLNFTYVRDADGHRILSLWGTKERREHIEKQLAEAGLLGQQQERHE